jgi:restriction system protein
VKEKDMWMVRSGRGGRYAAQRVEQGRVSLGWGAGLDPAQFRSKEEIAAKLREFYPGFTTGQIDSAASQIWRFITELRVGDYVATYDPETRLYHVGEITSEAQSDPPADEEGQFYRTVAWRAQRSRDELTRDARNSLGSVLTLFAIDPTHARQLISGPGVTEPPVEKPQEQAVDDRQAFENIENQALERIKDRINQLDWDAMQELVASLLRAMGYKTIISPAGPDRGKDIVASPDGFGFEQPRIVVEVKHRRGQMGAQEIRSFLGGRHSEDRGLYVSTGGFTKEAQYEAERASNVTHLMTIDGLARALIEHYEALDSKGRTLLPLTKIYWPA